MTWTSRKTALLLLVLLAAGLTAAWRAEIALHGPRESPARYFHWTLPLGAALLAGWAAGVNPRLGRPRRLWLALFVALVATLSCLLIHLALVNLFRGGVLFFQKDLLRRLGDLAALAGVLFIPLYFASAAWLVGLPVTWPRLACSLGLFWAAMPLAVLLTDVLDAQTAFSLAATLRGGYAIPFSVLSVGVLFLPEAPGPPSEPARTARIA